MIDRVAFRLQSAKLKCLEMQRIVGMTPTTSVERGNPVSSRRLDGPKHQVSTLLYELRGDGENLESYVPALSPLLEAVNQSHSKSKTFECDLVAMVSGRDLGFELAVAPTLLASLAESACGVVVDIYGSD